jgi:hypothetical protein
VGAAQEVFRAGHVGYPPVLRTQTRFRKQQHAKYEYEKQKALDDISFEIEYFDDFEDEILFEIYDSHKKSYNQLMSLNCYTQITGCK